MVVRLYRTPETLSMTLTTLIKVTYKKVNKHKFSNIAVSCNRIGLEVNNLQFDDIR